MQENQILIPIAGTGAGNTHVGYRRRFYLLRNKL